MFILLWSFVRDENERVVGPFPSVKDGMEWAYKYLDADKCCWNVKEMTSPAQYPAVSHSKRSEYDIELPSDQELVSAMGDAKRLKRQEITREVLAIVRK